jgi:transcriptional regulator with XRE-family HTH domain
MKLHEALRYVRSQRMVGQDYVALGTGQSPSFISLLESGSRLPAIGTLYDIASVLQVPVTLIIALTEEEELGVEIMTLLKAMLKDAKEPIG